MLDRLVSLPHDAYRSHWPFHCYLSVLAVGGEVAAPIALMTKTSGFSMPHLGFLGTRGPHVPKELRCWSRAPYVSRKVSKAFRQNSRRSSWRRLAQYRVVKAD